MAGKIGLLGRKTKPTRAVGTLTGSILVFVILAGCLGPSPGGEDAGDYSIADETPATTPTAEKTDRSNQHPSLESSLNGLVAADDREAYADERGLTLRDGRVEVVVELQPNHEFPEEFDADTQSRYEHLVQAFVPVDELVSLSEHENVSSVRPPNRAEPDEPSSDSIHT